jgi:hyperosmotically inducible periplasmic protein
MRTLGRLLFSAALLIPAISQAQTPSHSDPYIPGAPDEGKLVQAVRHQLVMLPYYTIFDDLGFKVEGANVILEGAVTNPTLKSDAENVVKRVEGVASVTNNIEVLPLSEMDWQIRRAVARSIYGDPTIGDRYGFQALPPIHVLVKNGNVTLEGFVNTVFDKNLINARVNGVPNVFHVTNNLQVVKGK